MDAGAKARATGLPRVERRRSLSLGEFAMSHDWASVPVILPGLCDHWPAMQRWNPEFFRSRYGDRTMTVRGVDYRFDDLLDRIEHSTAEQPAPYLHDYYIERSFPDLLADISPLPLIGCGRLNCRLIPRWQQRRNGIPELLIAGAGTRFPVLHYDLGYMHAFITQIQGIKHFRLYPPEDGRFLYPDAQTPNISTIDAYGAVDPDRYPLFARARPIDVTVYPGETIFVPSGWWHCTRIETTSVAVTWNVVTRANWPAYTADYVRTTRDSRPLWTKLKYAYLTLVGLGLNLAEAMNEALDYGPLIG